MTVVAALGWAVLITLVSHGDTRVLLTAGLEHRHPVAVAMWPTFQGQGYDGQFYAALATDPLLLDPATVGYLDQPTYRASRIGLPLAAWVFSGFDAERAVRAYQLLCWVTALVGIWIVARWLQEDGRSPWWALLVAASAGTVASTLRVLPDAGAAGLMLVAMWLQKGGRRGAVAVSAFACLVRETSLIGAVALAAVAFRERRPVRAILHVAVPIVLLAAWRAWVLSRPGFGWTSGVAGLGPPLVALTLKLVRAGTPIETIGAATVALGVVATFALRGDTSALTVVFAGHAALAVVLSPLVTVEFWAYGRALAATPMVACMLASSSTRVISRRTFATITVAYAVFGASALLSQTRWGGWLR